MKNSLLSLLQKKMWGASSWLPSKAPVKQTVEVYLESKNGQRLLVGRLSQERDEFVFRYDSSYKGNPIPAFPRTADEYRSIFLWPFFTTRIPPLDREDMQKEMENRSLDKDQVIEIPGTIAKVSATNPYQLKLVDGAT